MSYRRRVLLSFFVAIFLICSVLASVYTSFAQLGRQKVWVEHTYDVIDALQMVMTNLIDMQSSQRGYIITGYEEYLGPYHLALPRIEDGMAVLSTLIKDNREQKDRYTKLSSLVSERVALATSIVAAYKDDGPERAIAMVREGSGKREMDQIREIIGSMISLEQGLLQQRRAAAAVTTKYTYTISLAGLAVCLAILVAVFFLILREASRRETVEASLKQSAQEMESLTRETQMIGRLGDYLRGCRADSEAYSTIGNTMPSLFPESYGAVYVFNNSRNMLQSVLQWGRLPDVRNDFEPQDCWALRQGRIHIFSPDGTVPQCQHTNGITDKGVSICLPMQAHGDIIGQIFVGFDKTGALSSRQLIALRNVAEQISLALANINLQKALREQSIKDPLTKLFNRRYLEETLQRECSRALRASVPLCVLIMDIDHFKKVNDTYGHDGGDAALKAFADLLTRKIRKEDIACRLGGEEFMLVLPAATLELAKERAEDICAATRDLKVRHGGAIIPLTVSIGVAAFPDHGDTPEQLITNADQALYAAKRDGRDRVVVCPAKA